MKKLIFVLLISSFLISCSGKKVSEEVKNEPSVSVEIENKNIEQIFSEEAEGSGEVYSKTEYKYPSLTKDFILSNEVYPIPENYKELFGENLIFNQLPNVYVLGISPDGKIAWCENRFIDGKGSYNFKLSIIDLVSDEVLETFELELDDGNDELSMIKAFIDEKSEEVLNAFTQYNIQSVKTEVLAFPAEIGDSTYNANLTVKDTGKLLYDFLKLTEVTCSIEKSGAGKKTVSSQKEVAVEDAIIGGYIKSPFEDRIAVIITEAHYGFEGFDTYFTISGCDLTKNFK